ncbi:YlxR family protein [Nocardia sp. X0981]
MHRSPVEWCEVRSEFSVTGHERGRESAASRRRVIPIRTCVGCRKREPAAELLRIVACRRTAGNGTDVVTVVPDPQRRLPGRGAWLHPFSACLSAAVRRRAIGRALRVSGHLDISALEHHLENRHEHS